MAFEFENGVHGALQRRLFALRAEIAANPALSNGGRVLNVLDAEAVGWDAIRTYAERDGVVGLTAVPEAEMLERITREFGADTRTQAWSVFFGDPDEVVPAVRDLVAARRLPPGWRLESVEQVDEAGLAAMAELNLATGVRPTPGYFLRGEAFPSMTTLIWDADGKLAGCGNATMRYHPESRFAGGLFAGAVSVDPAHRGLGLGTLVNAALLRDAHKVFGWSMVIEQAQATNAASCGMLRRCGLSDVEGLVTIAVILMEGDLTR